MLSREFGSDPRGRISKEPAESGGLTTVKNSLYRNDSNQTLLLENSGIDLLPDLEEE